jgi:hypothetical protein
MSLRSKNQQNSRKKSPRVSMRLDRVKPSDLSELNLRFACEHCSHYDTVKKFCSMGFNPRFDLESQNKLYNLTGFMAFCRFLEID